MSEKGVQVHTEEYRSKLNENGRIVIPAGLRQEYGLKPGDEVVFYPSEMGINLMTPQMALKYIQAVVREKCGDVDLVNELFKMRREDNSA